jgi:hypothetical protein
MEKPPVVTNGVGMTIAGVAMVLIAGVGMFVLDQEVGVGLLALGLVFIAFGGRQHRSGPKSNARINTRDL